MTLPMIATLRSASLAMPEVEERDHFGVASWRVRGKIFSQLTYHPGQAILKVPKSRQEILFEVRPETFTPAVWGRLVWCTINLETIECDELIELTRQAWLEAAPKRLAAAYLSATS